jgi:hypothetical protein
VALTAAPNAIMRRRISATAPMVPSAAVASSTLRTDTMSQLATRPLRANTSP